MKDARKWTAVEIQERLRLRYSLPQAVYVSEVPNATSLGKSRTCDGFAVGCWHSRGIVIHGFEIKVARSDWLRELQDRSKSAAFERFCHHWWIVAPTGIVKTEELPASWGLMEIREFGFKVRSAPDLRTPEPITTEFLSALLRRVMNDSPADAALDAARSAGRDEGMKIGKADSPVTEASIWKRQYEELADNVSAFEKTSGVTGLKWDGKAVGADFKAFTRLMESGDDWSLKSLSELLKRCEADVEVLRAALNPVAVQVLAEKPGGAR